MYQGAATRSFFSLCVCLIGLLVTSAEAAKVTLEKQEIYSQEGELLGFRDFTGQELDSLGVEVIADYPTYVAGEVSDDDVVAFQHAATDQGILFTFHPEWDIISLNGYSFPSSGPPLGLPQDLQIPGFDGDIGLFLVQLKAPPAAGWQEILTRVGEVVGYYPWNTYLMRLSPAALETIRSLGVVQHVSPYQPAYKISAGLPDTDEPFDVVVALDAGQGLTQVESLLESYGAAGVSTLPGGSLALAQIQVDPDRLRALAHRPEVLWVEPVYAIEFSDERVATIVAGQYDGSVPASEPVRYPGSPGGHEGWLLDKGFCTPTGGSPGCMYFWTKVGLFDSGLDRAVCAASDYNEVTGVCSAWDLDRHPDLDHSSNLSANCPSAGEGMEGDSDCDGPVVYDRMFCWEDAEGTNKCLSADGQTYVFSDDEGLAGHGTSVGSIIAGDPHEEPQLDPGGYYRGSGVAPSTQLVLAKVGAPNEIPHDGFMTPDNWSLLVAKVNSLGDPNKAGSVRLANNSWNLKRGVNSNYDEYTLFSMQVDTLVRDADADPANGLQEMSMVFSVGNCNTPLQLCPAASPGNAKNVVSVGSSRGWSEVQNVADEECTDFDHSISDIAGFEGDDDSSWSRREFPTEPERLKPDLVAPGSQVAAARSSFFGFDPETNFHQCFWGTSASAPAATGAAVLAEAWYWHTFDHELPSPAMIKAMLVATADDLYGGYDYKTEEYLPHSPSIAQGWGRVNLDTLIPNGSPPTSPAVAVFDQDHGTAGRRFTANKQYWSVQLQVVNPAEDVIAIMVFTDAPSQTNAQNLVVNDLDLKITQNSWAGGAHTFWGNHFTTGSWYSEDTSGSFLPSAPKDVHNTVEVIRIPAGTFSGSFSLRVTAATIAENAVPGLDGGANNQDFALFVRNATQ